MPDLRTWVTIASDRLVLRRALLTGLVVGAVLTAVAGVEGLPAGRLPGPWWVVGLTFLVPFLVSVALSTVLINAQRTGDARQFELLEHEIEAINKFPDQNPNPVMRVSMDGQLRYANRASRPCLEAMGASVGAQLPAPILADLRLAASQSPPQVVEVKAGRRTFAILAVHVPELGVLNLYGTDVTAQRVVDKFPDRNPNPVLRLGDDGLLRYANSASAVLVEGLGLALGAPLPPALAGRVEAVLDEGGDGSVEVDADGRTYALRPVRIEEFGFINLYGTDITATKAMDRFPNMNPNPVLRASRDGILRYANPASALVLRALGVDVGEPLPEDFLGRVRATLAAASPATLEVRGEGRVYELLVVSVYEFGFINLYGTDVTAAREVEQANRENERLLLNILPASIAQRLRQGELLIADRFEEMTVLFADVVAFTELSMRLSPSEVVDLLNRVFSVFDRLADAYGLEKIKTIGDAYMVVGGLVPHATDHAERVAAMALDMLEDVAAIRSTSGERIELRIGMHVGPAVAGVIGIKKFIYDVWGDTVNTASRMESTGVPGRVQVTTATSERLGATFRFEPRGVIDVKGKGPIMTHLLAGRRSSTS